MGYDTDYNLEYDTPDDELDIKEALLKGKYLIEYEIDDLMAGGVSGRWHEHEEELLSLSRAFQQTIFILHGTGEEQGDVWKKRFINGGVETVRAELVMADFENLPEDY